MPVLPEPVSDSCDACGIVLRLAPGRAIARKGWGMLQFCLECTNACLTADQDGHTCLVCTTDDVDAL